VISSPSGAAVRFPRRTHTLEGLTAHLENTSDEPYTPARRPRMLYGGGPPAVYIARVPASDETHIRRARAEAKI
jgi:hypothetical protein